MQTKDQVPSETPPPDDVQPLTFRVGEEDAGQRLDVFLATRIDGWSRARLQRAIVAGEVSVAGHLEKPSYKLRLNEEVEAELVPLSASSFEPENIPLAVIHEDEESNHHQ